MIFLLGLLPWLHLLRGNTPSINEEWGDVVLLTLHLHAHSALPSSLHTHIGCLQTPPSAFSPNLQVSVKNPLVGSVQSLGREQSPVSPPEQLKVFTVIASRATRSRKANNCIQIPTSCPPDYVRLNQCQGLPAGVGENKRGNTLLF